LARADLFAALTGAILLCAVEPGSLDWCAIQKSMDAMHAGPVPHMFVPRKRSSAFEESKRDKLMGYSHL
jgi:hypothetical protein